MIKHCVIERSLLFFFSVIEHFVKALLYHVSRWRIRGLSLCWKENVLHYFGNRRFELKRTGAILIPPESAVAMMRVREQNLVCNMTSCRHGLCKLADCRIRPPSSPPLDHLYFFL